MDNNKNLALLFYPHLRAKFLRLSGDMESLNPKLISMAAKLSVTRLILYSYSYLRSARGQICPLVFLLFSTLSLGLENINTLKFAILLENSWNYISMYLYFPIRGQDYCWNFMQTGYQSVTYEFIAQFI